MIRYGQPAPRAVAGRILDLPPMPTERFIGLVAGHFATADTLTRATVERFVDEALAVGKP